MAARTNRSLNVSGKYEAEMKVLSAVYSRPLTTRRLRSAVAHWKSTRNDYVQLLYFNLVYYVVPALAGRQRHVAHFILLSLVVPIHFARVRSMCAGASLANQTTPRDGVQHAQTAWRCSECIMASCATTCTRRTHLLLLCVW